MPVLFRFMLLLIAVQCILANRALAQQAPERFRQADRNGDGRLSRDEVTGPVFDEMDSNKDESVSVEEAVAWATSTGNGQRNNRPGQTMSAAGTAQDDSALRTGQLRIERNLDYAGTNNSSHRLDLIIPVSNRSSKLPLVVYIHGGGWESGNRDAGRRFLTPVLETGRYAAASIEYRLSSEAKWPAQIHDCKAAIRWLRAHEDEYGFDAKRIAVVGESAGGHLASLVGVTNGQRSLEGMIGVYQDTSSDVQCVIDFYGPSDLKALGDPLGNAPSPISKLLGGSTLDKSIEAIDASAVTHVDRQDVPFMIIHGTSDPVVPLDQSERLHQALTTAGVTCYFLKVTGGQHGGFRNREIYARSIAFLDHYLRDDPINIDTSPVTP